MPGAMLSMVKGTAVVDDILANETNASMNKTVKLYQTEELTVCCVILSEQRRIEDGNRGRFYIHLASY
jgi:hypothetical protein